jgi:hypothetical protein
LLNKEQDMLDLVSSSDRLNSMNEKIAAKPAARDQGKKSSTTDLPMIDLAEAVLFVTAIHEKGLETLSMPELAKGLDYANPTSTPFYRRMVASRLFKLLTPQGAGLTELALDYLKPDTEEAKSQALFDAISSVPSYSKLTEKHCGKRLNIGIVANGMARDFRLSDDCANICAKAFYSSLKFGGFLDGTGTVIGIFQSNAQHHNGQPAEPSAVNSASSGTEELSDASLEKYFLTLDTRKRRRVIVQAPPSVTPQELKRIQDWLALQLIVEPTQPEATAEIPTVSK